MCSLDHAVALLTPRDRIIAERILLTLRARTLQGASHKRRTDALACLLVARRRRRTLALPTLGKAKIAGFAALTRASDNIWPTLALAAKRRALKGIEAALRMALALECAVVECRRDRCHRLFAEAVANVLRHKVGILATLQMEKN